MTTIISKGCPAARRFRWSQNPPRQCLLENSSHTSIDPPIFADPRSQRHYQPLVIPTRPINRSRCPASLPTAASAVSSKSP
jgi:hypothetical protein